MKVLMVNHSYLDEEAGGVYASRAYANMFADIADEMSMIFPEHPGRRLAKLSPRIRLLPIRTDGGLARKFIRLLRTGNTHDFGVERELAKGGYDLVVFNGSPCSYGQIDIAHRFGCKVITIHHNFQLEYASDNIRHFRRFALGWVEKAERESVLKSDLGLTLTQSDLEQLYKFYDPEHTSRIEVGGAFFLDADDRLTPQEAQRPPEPLHFVVTGNLSSVQTWKSLQDWADGYLDILQETVPGMSLTVAGREPSKAFVTDFESRGIEVVASPVSMREILLRAFCYLCPINLGSGIKLRLLDGLKVGIPAVSHVSAARGYEPLVGRYVFVYEDRAGFEKALRDAMQCTASRTEIADATYAMYSFDSGRAHIRKLLASL